MTLFIVAVCRTGLFAVALVMAQYGAVGILGASIIMTLMTPPPRS